MPAGQAEQEEAPGDAENVPGWHGVQASGEREPVAGFSVPAGHGRQAREDLEEEKAP